MMEAYDHHSGQAAYYGVTGMLFDNNRGFQFIVRVFSEVDHKDNRNHSVGCVDYKMLETSGMRTYNRRINGVTKSL